MPPVRNQGGDENETTPDTDPTVTEPTPTDPPVVVDTSVTEPVPEKDNRVRLQLTNTFSDGDSFTCGEYTIAAHPTLVPPEVADEIIAAAASAGVAVVNLDSQEG